MYASVQFKPTDTSDVVITADINSFGLGVKLSLDQELYGCYTLNFSFLFIEVDILFGIVNQEIIDALNEDYKDEDDEEDE